MLVADDHAALRSAVLVETNVIETAEMLWQLCPELQIVICTAYSDYSWQEMIRRLGIKVAGDD